MGKCFRGIYRPFAENVFSGHCFEGRRADSLEDKREAPRVILNRTRAALLSIPISGTGKRKRKAIPSL
jgi:hypothetical protein